MGLEKLNFDNIILLLTETLYFASVVGVQKAARVFFFFFLRGILLLFSFALQNLCGALQITLL